MAESAAAQTMPPDDPAAFAEAHRQLLTDRSIQFDMTTMKPPEIPDWVGWLLQALSSPVVKYIFWGVVGAGVLTILALIILQLPLGRWLQRRPRDQEDDAETFRPEAGAARALLREADALADAGRFDEAAHLLLFRSIEDIDERRPQLVRPALTSRDIAAATELPHGPREAFAAIAMMVERSLFGGRSLAEPDWRSCRSAYEEFAFAEAWG